MFHLAAWSQSQDTGGVLTYVDAVYDGQLSVSGKNITVDPNLPHLGAVATVGPNTIEAALEAPSLRRLANLEIVPNNPGATFVAPLPIHNLFDKPLALDPYEQVRALISETTAGVERSTVFVWFTDGPLAPVSGEIFTIKATASVTLTVYTWTPAELTLSETLPAGRYQLVGATHNATGLLATRFIFSAYPWRPGLIGHQSSFYYADPLFRWGRLGVWGEFEHTQVPRVEFFGTTVISSEAVYLDLIKIA